MTGKTKTKFKHAIIEFASSFKTSFLGAYLGKKHTSLIEIPAV